MTAGAVDYAATARRRPWSRLPGAVQDYVAGVLGAVVDSVKLAGGGFTHGFAANVSGAGGELFVKAAPSSDEFIYPAYVREAEVLASLPAGIPVPELLGAEVIETENDHWQVLCLRTVNGYMPGAPWTERDVAASHDSLVAVQDALAGLPRSAVGAPMAAEFADSPFSQLFGGLAASGTSPSFIPPLEAHHLHQLQQLCDHSIDALAGDAVLHNDLRADNLIIRHSDGKAFLCDWNFLSTGPAWADWVGLLLYTRPDGIDTAAWLARSPLSAAAADDDVDAWLAILGAYMVFNGSKPDIPTSPLLRRHGRYTARLIIEWLIERRGWLQ